VAQQVARGQRLRLSAGHALQIEQALDSLMSIRLLLRTRPSPKSQNVCQSMKRRGARVPPRMSLAMGLTTMSSLKINVRDTARQT